MYMFSFVHKYTYMYTYIPSYIYINILTHTYSERPEPYAMTFITYVSTLKLKHNSWILTTTPTCWILVPAGSPPLEPVSETL